jgi:hypothetical protein
MRALLFLSLVIVSVSCGGAHGNVSTDGGRIRVNCTDNGIQAAVTVVDSTGAVAPSASVTVSDLANGTSETLTTDTNGVVVVKASKFGPGVVRLSAKLNSLASGIGEITFVGGDCSSSVSPRSLTLSLK